MCCGGRLRIFREGSCAAQNDLPARPRAGRDRCPDQGAGRGDVSGVEDRQATVLSVPADGVVAARQRRPSCGAGENGAIAKDSSLPGGRCAAWPASKNSPSTDSTGTTIGASTALSGTFRQVNTRPTTTMKLSAR